MKVCINPACQWKGYEADENEEGYCPECGNETVDNEA